MNYKILKTPISSEAIKSLRSGDLILISGIVYSARDKAHQRLCAMYENNEELPVDLKGQLVYYVGPAPAPEGKVIGSAGPTTSYRMDPFTETMLEMGVVGMIGKGRRNEETRKLLQKYGAVYFSSFGGAGAYLGKKIIEAEPVAFQDLGPEAIFRMKVESFPIVVINDTQGRDLYEDAIQK